MTVVTPARSIRAEHTLLQAAYDSQKASHSLEVADMQVLQYRPRGRLKKAITVKGDTVKGDASLFG